ncbi:RagB/SusD family nutrient uptake outer membrane protein [Pseudopedobacter saltans]|nr:RagB/SusD family nutrient uptake outer membrane protein [Pseudopedobacter saltans]
MKSLKTIISFIAFGIVFTGCEKDFLQRSPLDEVEDSAFFTDPEHLKTYVNQFYNSTIFIRYANHGNDFDSDNQIRINIDQRLEGTRVISSTGSIPFASVRSINYFFDNYKRVEEKHALNTYKQYLGEAYFFRAVIYFNLLQDYGDIPWITTELSSESPDLYKPRDPRNIVADNIIAQLDSAAKYLTADKTSGAGRINKWMALLMQSRVALYEGTWEKYHNGTDFGVANPQPAKYFNKAVEAADKIMTSNLYDVYTTGSPSTDYKDLFALRDYSTNKEVMFWKKYDNNLSRGSSAFVNDRNFRMETPSGNTITKQLADSYLAIDGKPITGNANFMGYSTLKLEGQNRDPRFFQTIASPDDIWKIAAGTPNKFWKEVYDKRNSTADYNAPTGYLIVKGYNPNMIYHVQQFEETPSILYRYAEVLLNYAEAKAELGTIDQADINKTIKKLRDRVGMPNLILTNITTDPKWDFPTLSPIINEIRRERRVELALEGFRLPDILRWAAADELIFGKRPKGFLASQHPANTTPVDNEGFLDPYKNTIPSGYGFKLNRDYLNSIPVSERVLNPALTQNPGW